MTREEKQKALDVLKISTPIMAVTQEEFSDYIQTLNKIMAWLEQELTTRNCFGCKYSKDNHNAGTEVCHLCMWENQYTPTTKNDLVVDCISREQALNEFCIYNSYDSIGVDKVRSYLKALPSVTPQECKVGKWIFVEGIRGKDNVEKCSCCGSHWKEAIIYRTDTQEYLRTRLLYCPNCGSRNEVEE